MVAPFSFSAVAVMSPPTWVILAPIASKPLRWRSIGRLPIVQPPGIETFAWPLRARIGPSTTIDARILLTYSYGA